MTERQKGYWIQPDADIRGAWCLCREGPWLVESGLSKQEAEKKLSAALGEKAGDSK
jgi:hypothetical protein